MKEQLLSLTIEDLADRHPAFSEFILSTDGTGTQPGRRLDSWLMGLSEERLTDIGMSREQVLDHVEALARQVEAWRLASEQPIRSLTVIGGCDKSGRREALTLTLRAGDVVCIVGPTGSGKSRLLADIECLAQGDTPTGRRILVNDAPPDPGSRFASNRKLIAQLSQNMNFVVDLTVIGGCDKSGRPEALTLTLRAGDVVCIVGPTGSGKSRLLADIECLAQGDTPTGRRILVNDAPPDPGSRFASNRKLIAQLSQNMNFVVDLTVSEFLAMHADCRMSGECDDIAREVVVQDVIACANALAGEQFSGEVSLTQLSGGQTRALMIADTALLSASPVVLIDEIENAGIDRKKALELLIAREKIVLISTHDPVLALMGSRRIVIRNGAVADIIETGEDERANLVALERIDRTLSDLRHRLRSGERIAAPLAWACDLPDLPDPAVPLSADANG